MLIPYGMGFQSTVTGTVAKLVRCERCAHNYVYLMRRTSKGDSFSFLFLNPGGAETRARRDAEASLSEAFAREVDVVPCPACGWVQSHMAAQARREHTRWIRVLILSLVVASAVLFGVHVISDSMLLSFPGSPSWPAIRITAGLLLAVSLAGAALLVPIRPLLGARHDPNGTDPEARLRRGRARAVPREAYEKIMRDLEEEGDAT